MPSLPGFPCLASTEPEFRSGLVAMAESLDIDPDFIAGVMSFESNFDPAVKNPTSSGSGLIQMMEETAARLGTTTAKLRAMSRVEQLAYVERFFRPWAGRLKTPADTYLSVFYPCAIGKADNWVVARKHPDPSKTYCGTSADFNRAVYEQNAAAFDPGNRGYYAKADITRTFMSRYRAAMSKARIDVDADPVSSPSGCPPVWSGGKEPPGGGGAELHDVVVTRGASSVEKGLVLGASAVMGFYAWKLAITFFPELRGKRA